MSSFTDCPKPINLIEETIYEYPDHTEIHAITKPQPHTDEWLFNEIEFLDNYYDRAIEGMNTDLLENELPIEIPEPIDFFANTESIKAYTEVWKEYKNGILAEFAGHIQESKDTGLPLPDEIQVRLDTVRNFFNSTYGLYFDLCCKLGETIIAEFPDFEAEYDSELETTESIESVKVLDESQITNIKTI